MFLTQNSAPIIGFCAKLLGYVMQSIYWIFSNGLGIENIGLCIIVFTLIVKLLMIPLTIKQQKFTKLSSLMNPELQQIQKKYKGKRDSESMMKMNEETQAVYQKYGTSPTGSCLQLVIQMPILFSLYYIISSIPAYVPQVYKYYEPVSQEVVADYDYFKYMDKAYDKYVLKDGEKDKYSYYDKIFLKSDSTKMTILKANKSGNTESKERKTVDALAKFSKDQWSDLEKCYKNVDKMIAELNVMTDDDWKKLEKDLSESDKEVVEQIKKAAQNKDSKIELVSDKDNYIDSSKSEVISKSKKKIMKIYEFGPINLSQAPNTVMGIALIIPFLSFLTQWLSITISMRETREQMKDNPMNNSMKVMNIVMPLMSAFIAFTVPAGLGLYWAFTGLFQLITQLCINSYFKKVDVQEIIDENVKKMKKKKEKRGIYSDKVTSAANTQTKSIKNIANANYNTSDESGKANYKKGGIAEKANMLKDLNDKNRK